LNFPGYFWSVLYGRLLFSFMLVGISVNNKCFFSSTQARAFLCSMQSFLTRCIKNFGQLCTLTRYKSYQVVKNRACKKRHCPTYVSLYALTVFCSVMSAQFIEQRWPIFRIFGHNFYMIKTLNGSNKSKIIFS